MKKKMYYSLRELYHKFRNIISLSDKFKRRKIIKYIKRRITFIEIKGKFVQEKKDWIDSLISMAKESSGLGLNNLQEILTGFLEEPLIQVKKADTFNSYKGVILVSAIKNDIIYLRELLEYYRKIGVNHFALIDNGSKDGTLEFLQKQRDVTLYTAPYKFKGRKKAGWKLQVLAEIGLKRWYLWLDSDEFIVYKGIEDTDINEFVAHLYQGGYMASHGFMLDMYPDYPLMDGIHSNEDFLNDYRFYDPYNEYYEIALDTGILTGGMRYRVMGAHGLRLDKYPLVYCYRNHIPFGNHNISGIKKAKKDKKYSCILKHYKFLPEDTEKYKIISSGESGYLNPNEIKKYYNDDQKKFIAYYEESRCYDNSHTCMGDFPFFN